MTVEWLKSRERERESPHARHGEQALRLRSGQALLRRAGTWGRPKSSSPLRSGPPAPSSMLATPASLELEANHELHNARVAGAAHGPESIDVLYSAVGILIQVCDRRIRQAREVNFAVDAIKLRVIEDVEGVGAQLKPRPFSDEKALLDR